MKEINIQDIKNKYNLALIEKRGSNFEEIVNNIANKISEAAEDGQDSCHYYEDRGCDDLRIAGQFYKNLGFEVGSPEHVNGPLYSIKISGWV